MFIYFFCILELEGIKLNTLNVINSSIQVQVSSYNAFYGIFIIFKKGTSKSKKREYVHLTFIEVNVGGLQKSNMSMKIWPNIKSIKFSEKLLTLNSSCKNDQYIFFVNNPSLYSKKKIK